MAPATTAPCMSTPAPTASAQRMTDSTGPAASTSTGATSPCSSRTPGTTWFGTEALPGGFLMKIVPVAFRSHYLNGSESDADTLNSCAGLNVGNSSWGGFLAGTGNETLDAWVTLGDWTTNGTPNYICGSASNFNFPFAGGANEANFDFRVTIPQNSSVASTTTLS